MSDNSNPDLNDDDVLMSLLGETLDEAEPLSDEFVWTVADAAFELRRLDAVLADMTFDSMLRDGGTRSDRHVPQSRLLEARGRDRDRDRG